MSASNQESLSDWQLVVAYLSPAKSSIAIPSGIERHARLLCDGMGHLAETDLDPTDSYPLYDWSHVRDSSDDAIAECAAFLRRFLRLSELAHVANAALERGGTVGLRHGACAAPSKTSPAQPSCTTS